MSWLVSLLAAVTVASPWPATSGHAHNDYAQKRPLLSALSLRYRSIEADVYPVEGDLWVGHDRKDRTLGPMYVDRLLERLKRNHGSVYGDGREVILLVDIKEQGSLVYKILKRQLQPHASLLTRFERGRIVEGAIRVVLSGDRPIADVAADSNRLVFIDGRPEDTAPSPASSDLYSMISADWGHMFSWKAVGKYTPEEHEKLRRIVEQAHRGGQLVRFWATPDDPELWQMFIDAKVDLIGTDAQPKLAEFLKAHETSANGLQSAHGLASYSPLRR